MRHVLFFLLFLTTTLLAQEDKSEQPPDPSLLSPTWWEVFTENKDVVQKRIDNLVDNLSKIPLDLSESNREEAQNRIDQIKVNFQSWINILGQPLPLPKPSSTFKQSYTVDALLELNNLYLKEQVDLQSKRDELIDLKQQISTLQERLDLARQQYISADERSQDKMLYGLKILSLRPAVEVNRKKLSILQKNIQIDGDVFKDTKDEIQTAKNRLINETYILSGLTQDRNLAKKMWEDNKRARQKQEVIYAEQLSKETTQQAETNNQRLLLELTETSIKELQALNALIRIDVLFQLNQFLTELEKINLYDLDSSIKEWKAQLKVFKASVNDWNAQTKRIMQRAGQLLSLEVQATPVDKTQLNNVLSKAQSNLLLIQKSNGEINEVTFLVKILEEQSLSIRGQGEQWLKVVIDFATNTWSIASDRLSKTLFYIGTHPVSMITLLQFAFIMLGTWWFSRITTGTINTFSRRRKGIRKAVIYRLNRLIHYFILFVGTLIGLAWVGFDFSSFVLIAGALGVGIGFGLQNIFNNFISGIIILFQSHLKVGDFIELDTGLRGEIREINVRSTVITTNDGIEVIIPNSQMVSNRIVNWTLRDPYRRVHVPFTVAYGSDIEKVSVVVVEAAKKVPSSLQKIGVREPQIFLMKLGENGIEMELVVWVNEKWTRRSRNTRSQYLWAIEKTLRKHGFNIPYPQRDVHISKNH